MSGVALATLLTGSGLIAVAPSSVAASTASPSATGARPGATRVPFSINDELSASVDVGTGNLMVSSLDRSAPGINGMVNFGLSYQSLALASGSQATSGAGGSGWFMLMGQDNKLITNDDGSLLYLSGNGQQAKFTPVSGSSGYTSPAGFQKTKLVKNSDGTYSLTDLAARSTAKFGTDGKLVSLTDKNKQAITFTYSGGNVTQASLPTGQVVTFTFAGGKLASMTRPANGPLAAGTVTYTYEASGRLASIARPAVGGSPASTSKFTYSSAGDLASITDGAGSVTNFTYDSSHRVTAVGRGSVADQAVTRFSYVSATQTQVASPNTAQSSAVSAVPHTTYTLNSDDRVTNVTDAIGRSRSASYTPFFDIASASNGSGGTATATYGANAGSSMTKATNAYGASNSWTYGAGDNAYSPTGSTNASGQSSTMTYDAAGNGTSTSTGGASGATAKVSYNADGTLATSTDPKGKVTTYTESTSGKYIAKINPPAGSTIGATTISGNPATSVTNGAGETTTYSYNDRYALNSAATSAGTVSWTYDANGRVTSRTDKNQKVTYSYDARSNLTSIATTPVAGGTAPAAATVSYTYDKSGNMLSRTVAGKTTKYAYDAANQLTSLTAGDGAVTRFKYDGAGRRTDTWWRTNAYNPSLTAHPKYVLGTGVNLAQQWTSTNSNDSSRAYDYSYCYSKYSATSTCSWFAPSSANTDKIQYIQDNKNGQKISQLSYDTMGRLTGVTNWGGHTYAYAYDANGNRTSAKKDGVVVQTLAYNADNQVSSAGYTFDKAGRRTGDPDEGSTTWNALGQSVSRKKGANTGTYAYAGYGQDELIQQKDSNTTKTYVWGRSSQAGIPTMEYSTTSGSANAASVIDNDANGMPINMLSGSQSQYVVLDGLGRMWGTVSDNGQVTSTYEYDPYQQLTNIAYPASSSTTAAKTQTSQMQAASADAGSSGGGTPWSTFGVQDEVVKNWWKRGARWHDTSTGTWTSVDPITRLNDPTRANAYLYVGGDPINQFDPAGRDWWNPGDWNWKTIGRVTGDLSACAADGAAAAGPLGAYGSLAGPEAGAGAAAVGFVYGCGAGIWANEVVGRGWS